MEVTNRFVVIKTYIDDFPVESDFELKSEALSLSVKHGSDDIVVRNLYVSIDPYQINRMKSYSSSQKTSSFATPIHPGQPIDSFGVAEVVASGNPDFNKGDLVGGLVHWGEYSVIKAQSTMLRKLDTFGFPVTNHLSILGFNGLTAYAGLFEVGKVKEGEKVFVSAASGSVGSLVGQFAKLHGCYVVGCAGSDQKVALLKEKLVFDDAFNYKQEKDLKSTLEKYFPDGIDVYFDNVGAEMLDAAVDNLNPFGRVALCGVISEYTNSSRRAAPSMLDVVYKRISIQGFLAGDFLSIYPDFIAKATDYLRSGKIESLEDISVGVENIPSAFVGLFKGDNIGKKIVKCAE